MGKKPCRRVKVAFAEEFNDIRPHCVHGPMRRDGVSSSAYRCIINRREQDRRYKRNLRRSDPALRQRESKRRREYERARIKIDLEYKEKRGEEKNARLRMKRIDDPEWAVLLNIKRVARANQAKRKELYGN